MPPCPKRRGRRRAIRSRAESGWTGLFSSPWPMNGLRLSIGWPRCRMARSAPDSGAAGGNCTVGGSGPGHGRKRAGERFFCLGYNRSAERRGVVSPGFVGANGDPISGVAGGWRGPDFQRALGRPCGWDDPGAVAGSGLGGTGFAAQGVSSAALGRGFDVGFRDRCHPLDRGTGGFRHVGSAEPR